MDTAFVTKASLIQPRFTSTLSAWNEHIPAAGWLVEATRPMRFVELGTHSGVSYFAFCEAVHRLGLATECFAVDHWHGDEHSGFYGEEIHRSVRELNSHYESFSRLLRTSFDEAADEFDESSIDLLHIDGLHTYEAVRHDLETWLPKMSARGVVLLHDTNERKGDFGVYRLLAELAASHPTFEFTHGHGLGVVAVGSDVPPGLRSLLELDPSSDEVLFVREAYRLLGGSFSVRLEANKLSQEVTLLNETIADRNREIAALESQIDAERHQIDEERTKLNRTVEARDDELRRVKEARSSELQRLSRINREVENLNSELRQNERRIRQLQQSITQSSQRNVDLTSDLAKSLKRVDALETSTSWRLTKPVRVVADAAKRVVRGLKRPRTSTERASSLKIERMHPSFDDGLDRTTRDGLRDHVRRYPQLATTLVSVIMPTYNRASVLPLAISSVVDQTHEAWELLVIDDGSTDATEEVVDSFQDDRIRYVRIDRQGVGGARNHGLSVATGGVIAYLDSDNQWDPEFLELITAGLDRDGVDVAYSAVRMVEDDQTAGFRGDYFDYAACLKANYVDINALVHRRSPVDEGLAFEPRIRRTNDWDLILGLTYGREVSYLPFVGVTYSHDSQEDRISVVEPFVFRHIVEARHRARFEFGSPLETFEAVLARLELSIAIRIAAPFDKRDLWGDHHFATGLAQAFERLGHRAKVYYRESEVKPLHHDLVIVLRGLDRFDPVPQAVNILWSISHPDLVSHEEMRGYDLVFVASESYQRMLAHTLGTKATCLRQATDRGRFYPHPAEHHDSALLFVGNSRNVNRPSVRMAIDAGLPLSIHGSGWEGIAPEETIKSRYLPNELASNAYAQAAAVLNDHWESMREFGYISNRIYDALASGAHVISDHFPELERVYGDVLDTFRNEEDFQAAARTALTGTPDVGQRMEVAAQILTGHSLDARAVSIIDQTHLFLGSQEPSQTEAMAEVSVGRHRSRHKPLNLGIVPQMPGSRRWSSSAYIRLVLPLTSDLEGPNPKVAVIPPDQIFEPGALDGLDSVVISRTAVESTTDAERLVEHVKNANIPLIVDTDDAFHLMDESHEEYDVYRPRLDALNTLTEAAAELWCSTEPLRRAFEESFGSKAVTIANSIDPRLWRRYRERDRALANPDRRELVYFGTATHGADLALIMPVLDELARAHPGAFRLNVIGVMRDLPDRDWIERLIPPTPSTYPDFSRWMRDHAADFDIGIAPLANTTFNRFKSDIKLLEYTAMGLPAIVSKLPPYEQGTWADQCSGIDDWSKALDGFLSDRVLVDDRRLMLERHEEQMWTERRASKTGEAIVERILTLIGAGVESVS